MLRAVLFACCLTACGRSSLLEAPDGQPPIPRPPQQSPSALLGHWASFHIGNCVNDEAWLSFSPAGALTVTSVDRPFCAPKDPVGVSQGTYRDSGGTLQLDWSPVAGAQSLETTYAILPRVGPPDAEPMGYVFGDRLISMSVWPRSGGGFSRMSSDRQVSDGQTYLRSMRASVSFDTDVATAPLGTLTTATLTWSARIAWGADPERTLDETFVLACRIFTELGERRVRATVEDQYQGFWKLLVSRGLDTSYGWDLSRLEGTIGPDWVVRTDGLLAPAPGAYAPPWFELRHPPPSEP